MPNFYLSALAFADFGYKATCAALKSDAISEVVRAFVGNMDRVTALPRYPWRLMVANEGYFKAVNREVARLTGEPYPAILGKNQAMYNATKPLAVAGLGQIPLEEMQALEAEVMSRADPATWARMDAEIAACSAYLSKTFEAVLSGMIVGAWTAFETLAGDLWVATLNAHPRDLDHLSGEEKRIHKAARKRRQANIKGAALKPDKPNPRQQEGEKEIKIKAIHEITNDGYDLSARMGDLLKAKVEFTTLYDIRRAYSLAFDHKRVGNKVVKAVDDALASIDLDALAQIRNVIVHKAGIADADYEEHCETLPTMPQIAKGEPVLLDGEIVTNLICPVVTCCGVLLTTIDEWLHGKLVPPEHNAGAGI